MTNETIFAKWEKWSTPHLTPKENRDMEDGMTLEDIINMPSEDPSPNMSRNRPYTGQSHTDYGERGKTMVEGLTFRDVTDCFVRAVIMAGNHLYSDQLYAEACKGEKGCLTDNDLYGVNFDDIDPMAIKQNMTCEMERMMGIFPNVPKLEAENGQ